MERVIQDIVSAIRAAGRPLDEAWLAKLIRRYNRGVRDVARHIGKQQLLAFYRTAKEEDGPLWQSWGIGTAEDRLILRSLTVKPRRTASGVATITVLTLPHPCSGACIYCPNDIRMPKSYLANEPACQRAERTFFDPYLQVRARLDLLESNGHVTDKIELIVLGGTWSDYAIPYQVWFISELFRALNDSDEEAGRVCTMRRTFYRDCGLDADPSVLAEQVRDLQERVDAGSCSYNQAVGELYGSAAWQDARTIQHASFEALDELQHVNENALRRVVGLCVETRPDLVDSRSAELMRRLGCTKIQIGIQSLDQETLDACGRHMAAGQIARAFAILRLFGFKILAHMMANLVGATPERDKRDYERLVRDPRFLPDEVKLYPCVLVESAALTHLYRQGLWHPYPEDVLVDVLAADVAATPAYVRISRMIRDISSGDIVAGNTRTNLRQMVDGQGKDAGSKIVEIRQREIATEDISADDLHLACIPYTTTVSEERFLQWVTADGAIAGFLRLSLPHRRGAAMIREVHIYGRVAGLGSSEEGGAQHIGLGRRLVEEACRQARAAGYHGIRVISSVGTRAYYRKLGFIDDGLYQMRTIGA
ncbi:tRNA uridine(34) 5-carboxymethylaminomethyl modification radical SAM/GNAT enzyme Elp3 [Coriobacteriales bacterium OH1046]|nr:tRNA uridine(34) 5-carboxymethylaminomethyl modification radical SAM/GNAT enzyme Elp3 [Coriobacteriales bacterium OH1046]